MTYPGEGDSDNVRGKIVERCTIAVLSRDYTHACTCMHKFMICKADEKFPTVESVLQSAGQYFKYWVIKAWHNVSIACCSFNFKYSFMKKIMMTACVVAFMSMMALAQNVDSTQNQQNGSTDFRNNPIQDSAMTQPVNPQPIEGTPRTQDATSPIIQQQQQQTQPQIQTQPQQQAEPQPQQQQLESPLQTQPQVPTQSQPTLDSNSPTPQQDQLNQPVQPTQPQQSAPTSPANPAGSGTRPR